MPLAETLSTPRLRLIRCGPDSLRLLATDPTGFETRTGLRIEPGYLEFPEALGASLEQLQSAGPDAAWWCPWVFVHQRDLAVIGLGGYKGPPSGDGVVEIGYGVAPRYRGAGYATEAARALLAEAFRQAGVQLVCAHTLPRWPASARVLAKCGLRQTAESFDPVDGPVCRWERGRDDPDPDPASNPDPMR